MTALQRVVELRFQCVQSFRREGLDYESHHRQMRIFQRIGDISQEFVDKQETTAAAGTFMLHPAQGRFSSLTLEDGEPLQLTSSTASSRTFLSPRLIR